MTHVDSAARDLVAATNIPAGRDDAIGSWITLAVRLWLVAMFLRTLEITWPLWTYRVDPPLLPLVALPRFEYFGWLMGAAYASCLVWPRAGLLAAVVVCCAAMTADQTRMQPQLFSFWLLMLGTWREPAARFIGRCHLASLWFFSGFHKLLSDGYFEFVGPWLFQGIFPVAQFPQLAAYERSFSFASAGVEVALGVLIFIRQLRPIVAVVAALLHVGIVVTLWRLDNWNPSVWPWNLAIAAAAPVAVWSWKTRLVDEPRRSGLLAIIAGTALFFSPLLFYIGRLDAYLSHCLYSNNVPTATMIVAEPDGRLRHYNINSMEGPYWRAFEAPQPPTHRNFELYFRAVAKPGNVLIVDDERAWAKSAGYARYEWRYDGGRYERVPLPALPNDQR